MKSSRTLLDYIILTLFTLTNLHISQFEPVVQPVCLMKRLFPMGRGPKELPPENQDPLRIRFPLGLKRESS